MKHSSASPEQRSTRRAAGHALRAAPGGAWVRGRGAGLVGGLVVALLVGPSLLPAGPAAIRQDAAAHVVRYARMLHVRVESERLLAAVAIQLHGGGRLQALKEKHDRNDNGLIDDDERDALAAQLESEAWQFFSVELDGVPIALEGTERHVALEAGDGVDDAGGLVFRASAVLMIQMRPGTHELRLRDAPDSPADVLPLRVDAFEGAKLVSATVEDGATPPSQVGAGSWLAGFAGQGGAVVLSLQVGDDGPAAAESPAKGLGSTGSEATESSP